MTWMPSNDTIAQLGHSGWGALIVLSFYVFFPVQTAKNLFSKLNWWHFAVALLGLAGVLVWSVPKELVFDAFIEQQKSTDNWKDLAFYMLGAGGAVIALFVKTKLAQRAYAERQAKIDALFTGRYQ